jgi:hypothetical protein
MNHLGTILASVRSFVEECTGISTYSERFGNMLDNREILIHLDDGNPWRIGSNKESIFLFNLIFRYKLDEIDQLSGDFFEADAQSEVYTFLTQLLHTPIPPGIILEHRQTRCSRGSRGEYVIINKLEAYLT